MVSYIGLMIIRGKNWLCIFFQRQRHPDESSRLAGSVTSLMIFKTITSPYLALVLILREH